MIREDLTSDRSGQANSSEAAVVCVHVAKLGYPILRAERDEPTIPEDSGWQFLCNTGAPEEEAEIWAVSEVLEHEPSLVDFIDSPVGTSLVRDDQNTHWRTVDRS